MVDTSKLRGAIAESGLTQGKLAVQLGMMQKTFYYNRLREPDTFTVGELKRAAKKFKITLSQLMGAA